MRGHGFFKRSVPRKSCCPSPDPVGRTYFDFETLRRKGGRRPPFTKVSLLDREIFGQHHSGRNWMLRDFRMPNRSWGMRRGRPLCPGPSDDGESGK
ncbi:MAG: hypothetical protein ACLUIW_08240 [Dysosmobacter welbionis]